MKFTSECQDHNKNNSAILDATILTELPLSRRIVFDFFFKRKHLVSIYHSHAYIAQQTNLNISTVKRALIELKAEKFLTWLYRHRKTNIYIISPDFDVKNYKPKNAHGTLLLTSNKNERPRLFSYLLTQIKTMKVRGSSAVLKIASLIPYQKDKTKEEFVLERDDGNLGYRFKGKEYLFKANGIPFVVGGESLLLDEHGNFVPEFPVKRRNKGLPENHKRARMNVIEEISRKLYLTELGKQVLLQFNSVILTHVNKKYSRELLKTKNKPVLYLVGACEALSKERGITPNRRDYFNFVRNNPDAKEFMNMELFNKSTEATPVVTKSRVWVPEPPRQDIPETLEFLDTVELDKGASFFRDILLQRVRLA